MDDTVIKEEWLYFSIIHFLGMITQKMLLSALFNQFVLLLMKQYECEWTHFHGM
jgi:hypothetical protein